jgi:hypothetical protein
MKKINKQTRKVSIPQKIERKILGVTASLKNVMIAIVMLFAFLGGFFQVFNWLHSTFADRAWVKIVELKGDFERENNVLNSMYARFCTLDNMFMLSPDPTKVDPELRKEWLELKTGKMKLQEEKVKDLQQQLQRK